jgi:hypothetical protein
VLPQYVFSFSYDEQGGVSMAMGAKGKGKKFAYKPNQANEAVGGSSLIFIHSPPLCSLHDIAYVPAQLL